MQERVTILIVDDKPANIYALETLLDKPDRIFLNATNGNDALKHLKWIDHPCGVIRIDDEDADHVRIVLHFIVKVVEIGVPFVVRVQSIGQRFVIRVRTFSARVRRVRW